MIKNDLLPAGAISWFIAAVPSIAGIFVLIIYARFLREADELQRIIQLQALAFGFGGTFFAIAGYRVFERRGAPTADITDFTILMSLLYTIATLIGWRRYR